jgi:hypothetical protein
MAKLAILDRIGENPILVIAKDEPVLFGKARSYVERTTRAMQVGRSSGTWENELLA